MTTEQTVPPTNAAGRVPQTLPAVLRTAIASHSGVAMRSPDPSDPHALSYADVGSRRRRDRRRARRPRRAARRSRRDPRQHARRVGAGRPGCPVGRRHRGAHLQHELRRGVPVRARALRLARRLLRGRGTARQDRQHRRALPRPRAPRRPDGLGAGGDDPGRPARARAGAGRAGRRRAHRRRAARRRGHDRLHVGHDRAAQGLHAHARQHAGHDRPLPGPAGAGRRDGRLPLPATRARSGPRDADGRADRGRDHRLLARRPQADRRRAGRGAPDALPLGPAHLREDPHRRPGRRGGAGAAQAGHLRLGAGGGPAGAGSRAGRQVRRARSRAGVTTSPTASCCPRSAASSATACTWRSPAPRRSAPTSSSSSTPAACSCSRATG